MSSGFWLGLRRAGGCHRLYLSYTQNEYMNCPHCRIGERGTRFSMGVNLGTKRGGEPAGISPRRVRRGEGKGMGVCWHRTPCDSPSWGQVCGYRLRLHFDGYSECHDFWINANSPDIHPAGWFEKTGHKLQPPKGKA